MDLMHLEQALVSGSQDEASAAISEVSRCNNKEVALILIYHLKNTENKILRNEIALALSDIRDPAAVEPIIDLLKNPKTLGSRGSLLYALRPFDYSSHLELLIDFVINGNFEVRHEANYLLQQLDIRIPENLINKIKKSIDDYEDRIDLLLETLSQFENEK
ncbi:HEAT repeat domain-containing protein [Paenibacillus aurantiacus]|uniref:HEAT repeat domain-containing protein n=1 Tax=Paenibacillus aurantiacus TaxID=1936118 RepID=A0ABV5L079_9BACL